jgi:hypothetical protein
MKEQQKQQKSPLKYRTGQAAVELKTLRSVWQLTL